MQMAARIADANNVASNYTMAKLKDINGERFGRLVAQWPVGKVARSVYWLCVCECGQLHIADGANLRGGHIRSCGCWVTELAIIRNQQHNPNLKHGDSRRGKRSAEYHAWLHLIDRCCNPANDSWESYGGRGISVCKEWRESFAAFLADVGRRPSRSLSIDRINNDGNYEPGNCRWATRREQRLNQRLRRTRAA